MAIVQSVCTSFKKELLQALHNFTTGTGHAFRLALYTTAAALDSTTSVYTAVDEVVGVGYTAGGNLLTIPVSLPATSGVTAWADFSDSTWVLSTITARGAMIYNTSSGNKACVILDFGAEKSSSAGDFSVVFPAPAASTAIIRIS